MSGNAIHLKISLAGPSAAGKDTVALQIADPPMWKARSEERGEVDWEKAVRLRREMVRAISRGGTSAQAGPHSGLRNLKHLGGLLCDQFLSPGVKKA